MQWHIRDWMRAIVLLAVACACLRMGCQVDLALEALDQAKDENLARYEQASIFYEWRLSQARTRQWRAENENERLRTVEAEQDQVIAVLVSELQEREAATDAAASRNATVPCVDPS